MASVTFHDQSFSLNRLPSSPIFRNLDFGGTNDFASRISERSRIPPLSLPSQFHGRDSEQNKGSLQVPGGASSPNLSPTALKLLQNFYLLAKSGAGEDDDEFRMYDFKVRLCRKAKNHDWTECPFAHPGERARRRDPRKYAYSGSACLEFRKAGTCSKGDSCDFAHGVFECWLHPERYRTQVCKDGVYCNRKVCFFAHIPEEMRVGSPVAKLPVTLSLQASTSAGYSQSNPISPNACRPRLQTLNSSPVHSTDFQTMPQSSALSLASSNGMSPEELDDLIAAAMKQLKLRELAAKASLLSPTSYPFETATQSSIPWENDQAAEPSLQRVESGRALRAEIYGKLSKGP